MVDRAVGLLFARLVFPDAMGPVLPLLAAAHCAAAAVRLGRRLLHRPARQATARQLQKLRQRSKLVDLAVAGAEQLGRAAWRYGEPAGVLLLLAAAWAAVHPSSQQVAEAVAALIPVLLGYQQTSRQCAVGQLLGPAAEEAWHRRHKWAARRTAHLQRDLPDSPPLAGAADAWDAMCLSIAVAVGGLGFGGSGLDLPAGSSNSSGVLGGWGAGSDLGGWQLWGSVALGRGGGGGGGGREAGCGRVRGSAVSPQAQPTPTQDAQAALGQPEGAPAGAQCTAGALPGMPPSAAAVAQPEGAPAGAQRTDGALPGMPPSAAAAAEPLGCPVSPFAVPLPEQPATPVQQRQQQQQQQWAAILDSPSELCAPLWKGQGQEGWNGQPPPPPPQPQQHAWALNGSGSVGSEASSQAVAAMRDFMHPAHWAAARAAEWQQERAPGRGGATGAGTGAAATGSGGGSSSSSSGRASFLHSDQSDSGYWSSDDNTSGALFEGSLSSELAMPPGALPAGAPAGFWGAAAAAVSRPAHGLSPASGLAGVPWGAPGHASGEPGAVSPIERGQQGQQQKQQREEIPPLAALYGEADHLLHAHPLTALERLQLGLRAVHLVLLFAPFLLLGGAMLLLAAQLPAATTVRRQRAASIAAAPPAAVGSSRATRGAARLRVGAFRLLLWACRHSGAAFIKWGQWTSTREDVFPEVSPSFPICDSFALDCCARPHWVSHALPYQHVTPSPSHSPLLLHAPHTLALQDFCAVLSELHDRAPVHSPAATRRIVEAALGRPLEEAFLSFEEQPLASGSIAQVRARVRVSSLNRPVPDAVGTA